MGDRLHGRVSGLAASELKALENLYRRRLEPERAVTHELARELAGITARIGRNVGVVIDRRGRLIDVSVGDALEVPYPAASAADARKEGRLCGLRFVRTKPENTSVGHADRLVLTKYGLDALVFVGVDRGGTPRSVKLGMIYPPGMGEPIEWLEWAPSAIPDDFLERVKAREDELSRTTERGKKLDPIDRALLVGVTTGPPAAARESLAELSELARSCGMVVVDRLLQRRERVHPATLVGSGFLEELVHRAAVENVGRLVVDGELTPMQARNIERQSGLAVMDRTMLILEIFGRRAVTTDGKLRVDLAKLRYLGPHLQGKGIDLSRLGGGKGRSRGAGEMKLEMDRRTLRDNIVKLEKQIAAIGKRRAEQRKRRLGANVPQVALIGYTNAGKSTLFNALTGAGVLAEDLLFATLETTTRRARLPRGTECVFIDTVGFIRDLPEGLLDAFRATIEEIDGSHLLLHVVDASNEAFARQIDAVDATLRELGFDWIPKMLVFNKRDRIDEAEMRPIVDERRGILLSSKDPADVAGLARLVELRLAEVGAGHDDRR